MEIALEQTRMDIFESCFSALLFRTAKGSLCNWYRFQPLNKVHFVKIFHKLGPLIMEIGDQDMKKPGPKSFYGLTDYLGKKKSASLHQLPFRIRLIVV